MSWTKELKIKKLHLILTDTAKADLRNIHDYIHDDNPKAAKEFAKDLTEKLFSLAENGNTGHARDWVSGGLRAFPYRERCFYFRIVEDQMIIVRILHGAQDVTTQDFS